MRGKAYGVGVGPGDPELMTLRAVRLIRENEVIAVPGKNAKESAAYRIAAGAVPEIADKTLVPVYMPMVRDRTAILREHRKGAAVLEEYLAQGRNVVFLTLGDPTIYCTFSYLQKYLEADGYEVELVSGVPSFCAAAAKVNLPLAEGEEQIHIIPAVCEAPDSLSLPGTCVLMKSASRMKEARDLLSKSGRKVCCVENCGMEDEKVYFGADRIPDDAGYFSLVIAKEN